MNKTCMVFLSCLSTSLALGEHRSDVDYAKVVSSQAVYRDVAYNQPREHCWQETVSYRRSHSGAAPILGAIIGGVIGNELGHGRSNRHIGTAVGAVVGASIGGEIAREQHGHHYAVEQHCGVIDEVHYRQEVVGYDVTYRYHGRDYHTRLPYDPGKRLKVTVKVSPLE